MTWDESETSEHDGNRWQETAHYLSFSISERRGRKGHCAIQMRIDQMAKGNGERGGRRSEKLRRMREKAQKNLTVTGESQGNGRRISTNIYEDTSHSLMVRGGVWGGGEKER